jgi:hypothetical protein
MRILFLILGLLGIVFKFLYICISEIYFLILDLFMILFIKIKDLFWFLVKFGRIILDKPYIPIEPKKKIRKRRK